MTKSKKSKTSRIRLLALGALCGVLPWGASASAQGAPGMGQQRGLFGQSRVPSPSESVDLSAVVVEAYDDDVFADRGGAGPNPLSRQESGYYTMLVANFNYAQRGGRTRVGANASSTLRYFGKMNDVDASGQTAGVGVTMDLSSRHTLTLGQTAAYSPAYLTGLFPRGQDPVPGESLPPSADYRVDASESYSYGTELSWSYGIGPRSHLVTTGDFQYTDFRRETASRPDANAYGVRTQFVRNTTRNTELRLGYSYRSGNMGYGGGLAATIEQGLDAGMQYTKVLSATRRATFSFRTGASAVDVPVTTPEAVSGRLFRATGDADMSYQFRRWQVRAAYRHGLEFVADLVEPVFTRGVSFDMTGLLTRRMDLTASAGYATGASALNRQSLTFDTYTATTRMRYAVSSTLAAQVEYLYYFYDFLGGAHVPFGRAPRLARNGVRAGISVWVPLLQR